MIIFIFRRDFRLDDNVSFIKAVQHAQRTQIPILPLFIYNKEQIDHKSNKYFSHNSMQFLVESLNDLERQIKKVDAKANLCKLLIEKTSDELHVIADLHSRIRVSSVFFNKDLTPFARMRDKKLMIKCKQLGINVYSFEDYTLFPLQEVQTKTNDGNPYRVFSFLYRKRKELHKIIPRLVNIDDTLKENDNVSWFDTSSIRSRGEIYKVVTEKDERSFYNENKNISVRGGREKALKILHNKIGGNNKLFKDYEKSRDEIHNEEGTTRLSAYLKFGCLSIRELYWRIYDLYGIDHALIRELFFREFYYNISWFFPYVLEGMKGSHEKNKNFIEDLKIPWYQDNKGLSLWKKGKTGTPLVDAGMRQLNETGFMHNRCRMVVSMYLTKDLFVDWREGEKYFSTKLVDYHPIQNNAGWQWSASTGTDASPYFRVMNPYTQSRRFDKNAIYIKQWVPELKDVDPKDIHNWDKDEVRKKYHKINYPDPYVQNRKQKIKDVIDIFKKAVNKKQEIKKSF